MNYYINDKTDEYRSAQKAQNLIGTLEPIDPETLASLDLMTQPELIALIRRVSGAMWAVGIMDDDQRAAAIIDMLAITALTSRDRKDARECGKEWLDRKQGKATQRIEQKNLNVNVSAAKEMTTEEILARLASASPAALESAGVKLIGGRRVERLAD